MLYSIVNCLESLNFEIENEKLLRVSYSNSLALPLAKKFANLAINQVIKLIVNIKSILSIVFVNLQNFRQNTVFSLDFYSIFYTLSAEMKVTVIK